MNLAETFERVKREATRLPSGSRLWPEDKARSEDCYAVLVDGFNSQSPGLIAKPPWSTLDLPLRPFSYREPGWHYSWNLTWDDVHIPARLLARSYLPKVGEGQRIIPIGCSLGGVVTLLGCAIWIRECRNLGVSRSVIRNSIPKLVMVAPALCPPERLLAQYQELMDSGRVAEVPTVILQLARSGHELGLQMEEELISALELLHAAGIEMHEIVCPDDAVCPKICTPRLQAVRERTVIQHDLLCDGDSPVERDERRMVMRHLRFLGRADVAKLAESLVVGAVASD